MPTPFMHMALAHRLISDPELPNTVRELLQKSWGPFLLGSIAPDARVSSGLSRVDTHFFDYGPVVDPSPVAAMLSKHPSLERPAVPELDRLGFVTGYVAHLAMDEIWCVDLLYPAFITNGDWAMQRVKFVLLHMLLAGLDERDRAKLPDSDYSPLAQAAPHQWLPFMDDDALIGWRDLIAPQIAPGAESRTLEILGKRIDMSPAEMSTYMTSGEHIGLLRENVRPELVSTVEESMYTATRAAVIRYLAGYE